MPISPEQILRRRQLEVLRRTRLKDQLNLQKFDVNSLSNALPKNLQPQGFQKIPDLIFNQGQKILSKVIPGLNNLLEKFGIESIETFRSDIKTLSPSELQQKYCPTKPELDKLVLQRNNLVDYLNGVGQKLDQLSTTIEFGTNFASLVLGLTTALKTGKTLAQIALSFIPFGLPGAAVAAIDKVGDVIDKILYKNDGSPRIPPIIYIGSAVSVPIAAVQAAILKSIELLNQLDTLILICDPNVTLTNPSQSISGIAANELLAQNSSNNSTYKGFILEIETRKYTDTVNQNRAVGKNQSGIVLISTAYSFASNPNVLIDELKFIIDRDDLKSY